MEKINFKDLYGFFDVLLLYWYVALPFAIALLFAARWFPKVLIAALGFVGGLFFLMPLLKSIPMIEEFLIANPGLDLPMAILVGVICAVVAIVLFKFIFLVGGLLVGFFIGVWIWNVAFPWINQQILLQQPDFLFPTWAVWVFAGVFAVIIGISAIISHEKTISFLSILTGALILDFFLLYLLGNWNSELFGTITKPIGSSDIPALSTIGLLVFFASLLLLMFAGYRFAFSHRKKKEE